MIRRVYCIDLHGRELVIQNGNLAKRTRVAVNEVRKIAAELAQSGVETSAGRDLGNGVLLFEYVLKEEYGLRRTEILRLVVRPASPSEGEEAAAKLSG